MGQTIGLCSLCTKKRSNVAKLDRTSLGSHPLKTTTPPPYVPCAVPPQPDPCCGVRHQPATGHRLGRQSVPSAPFNFAGRTFCERRRHKVAVPPPALFRPPSSLSLPPLSPRAVQRRQLPTIHAPVAPCCCAAGTAAVHHRPLSSLFLPGSALHRSRTAPSKKHRVSSLLLPARAAQVLPQLAPAPLCPVCPVCPVCPSPRLPARLLLWLATRLGCAGGPFRGRASFGGLLVAGMRGKGGEGEGGGGSWHTRAVTQDHRLPNVWPCAGRCPRRCDCSFLAPARRPPRLTSGYKAKAGASPPAPWRLRRQFSQRDNA